MVASNAQRRGRMNPRRSAISVVLFRLRAGSADFLLLLRHRKWGDWGLVGGHIEADETPLACAERETGEELAPLRPGIDFNIEPLMNSPLVWGPVHSISAGAMTEYTAWMYSGRFTTDPRLSLRRVADRSLVLVPLASVTGTTWPAEISDVLARFLHRTAYAGERIPLAWYPLESPGELGLPIIRLSHDAGLRAAK